MDWIWYIFVVVVVGRSSWRQRVPEMKFPDDPELIRAVTGRDTLEAVSWITVESGYILGLDGLMALTMGRGGRMGHAAITCPVAPQYKHNPCDKRRCLSMRVSRVLSICMGSGAGSGGLMFSGRRRRGINPGGTC